MFGDKLKNLKDAAGKAAATATETISSTDAVSALTKAIPTEKLNTFAASCKDMLPDAPEASDVLDTLPKMHSSLKTFQGSNPAIGAGVTMASTFVRGRIEADPLRGGLLNMAEEHGSAAFGEFLTDMQDDDLIMLVILLIILFFVPNPFSDILDAIGLAGDMTNLLSFLG